MKKRIILLFSLFILSGCSSVLFYPTRFLYSDPAQQKLKFDETHFNSLDGTRLYGWYFHHKKNAAAPTDKPKAVILYAHGNAQNISSHYRNLDWILDEGYDFFIFDYRGYGVSADEKPDAQGAIKDTIAALRLADEKAKKLNVPLVVFAQSLGTPLAVRALVEEKANIHPVFIALDSPFLSFQWAGASVLSQSWLFTLFQPFAFVVISDEWAPRERIRELSPTPILIIHGDRDRVIDVRLGKETYDAALPPKEFIQVPGAGHIQAFWGPEKEKYRKLFVDKMDTAVRSH